MRTPLARAVISFNFLACVLALAAGIRYVVLMPGSGPWWDFVLTVGAVAFVLSLPFSFFLSSVFERGGDGTRYFVNVLNLIFSVFGAFNLYDPSRGQAFDGTELFAIGLTPIALANVAYLIFEKE